MLKRYGPALVILLIVAAGSISGEPQQGSVPAKFGYDGYKSACCHTECCCTTCPQGCNNPPPATQQRMVPMNGNKQADELIQSLSYGFSCICETNSAFSCKVRDPSQPTSYQGPVYPPPPEPTSYNVQPPFPQFPTPSYVQPAPPYFPPDPNSYITPINGSGYAVPPYVQPVLPSYLPPPQYGQPPPGYTSKLKGQVLISKDCTCEMSRTSYCRPVGPCPTDLPYYTTSAPSAGCLQTDFFSILSTGWGLAFFIALCLALLACVLLMIIVIWLYSAKKTRIEPVQARVVPGLPRTGFSNRAMSTGDETVEYRPKYSNQQF